MSRLSGIAVVHPVVVCANLDDAVRYYCDVIGLIESSPARHNVDRLARLSGLQRPIADAVVLTAPGGGEIELVQFYRPLGQPAPAYAWQDFGIKSITFQVELMAAALERVRAAGHHALGEVVRFPEGDRGLDVVYVSGPDDVVLTLIAPAPLSDGPDSGGRP